MSTFRQSLALAAMALMGAGTHAVAEELVTNGGFETGSFAGWTHFGNTGFADVSNSVQHSGSFGALFGPIGVPGGIMQTLSTLIGLQYDYSFWLQNSGDAPNSFSWSLNGVTQTPALSNAGAFAYSRISGTFVAADNATELAFSFRHDPGFWYLDDVSVSVVPEPSALLLMCAGLAVLALARRSAATG